jgi:hypothetical protein
MNILFQVKARLFNLAQKINQHKDDRENEIIPFDCQSNEQVIYGQSHKENPVEAGIETAEVLPMLDENAIADSIKYVKLESLSAIQSKDKLEFFFDVLKKSTPKLIGGKMPDEGFYYQ